MTCGATYLVNLSLRKYLLNEMLLKPSNNRSCCLNYQLRFHAILNSFALLKDAFISHINLEAPNCSTSHNLDSVANLSSFTFRVFLISCVVFPHSVNLVKDFLDHSSLRTTFDRSIICVSRFCFFLTNNLLCRFAHCHFISS